jgi:sialidase-1
MNYRLILLLFVLFSIEAISQPKLSTRRSARWYYIVSAHDGYAKDKAIAHQGTTGLVVAERQLDPTMLWKFISLKEGKIAIQNMATSEYIHISNNRYGTATTPYGLMISPLEGSEQHLIHSTGDRYLHAQQSGSRIVSWNTNTINSASAWQFVEVPSKDLKKPVSLASVLVDQGTYTTTAIGDANHGIARIELVTSGITGSATINSVTIDLQGTTRPSTISNIKLFNGGTSRRLDTSAHELIASASSPASTTRQIELKLEKPLKINAGRTILHLATDISKDAQEGDIVDSRILAVNYTQPNGRLMTKAPINSETPHYSIVYLKRIQVLTPGEYGSVSYRIPAIVTAADGSLVVLTDKRKYNSVDLPEDIDVIAQRSTDGGSTWSKPITVAEGTGHGKGYGDVAVIRANSGRLIALYVGGPGLWASTPENPNRHYMSYSDDHGISWTAPEDITPQIYGTESSDPIRSKWRASFVGSGQGLCTRDGRVMAVLAVREPDKNGLHNYLIYSDDEGKSWHISERAIEGGDEAKVVELDNGDILMSSRIQGNRLWAKSNDGGLTWGSRNQWEEIWGNACDADLIRYTSVKDGYDKSRLLHTLPNHRTRRNLTMWMSYDEGESWPVKKVLCPGTSAYSSFTILPDGTIGVYFEEDESEVYTMTYINFTLDWLSSGTDSYNKPTTK